MTPEALRVWRDGIAPQLSLDDLRRLLHELESGGERLCRQATVLRPAGIGSALQGPPIIACCPIAFVGWARGLGDAYEVEEFAARLCWEADQRTGEVGCARHLMHWWDWNEDVHEAVRQFHGVVLQTIGQRMPNGGRQ